MAPFWHGRGLEYKRLLVRAALAGVAQILAVDPDARFLSVDPLVRQHVHPAITDPYERARLQGAADEYNAHTVLQAFEMLSGRLDPELGGSPRALGVVGLNYYDGNQWTVTTPRHPRISLPREGPAVVPLSELLREVHDRLGAPIVVAETGASGAARASWFRLLTRECRSALELGVDLQGICIYPVVTSPDWDDPTAFFDGGLFDISPDAQGRLDRHAASPVMAAYREAQAVFDATHIAPQDLGVSLTHPRRVGQAAGPVDLSAVVWFPPDNFSYATALAGDSMTVEAYGLEIGGAVQRHRHRETEHVLTVLEGWRRSMSMGWPDSWAAARPCSCQPECCTASATPAPTASWSSR